MEGVEVGMSSWDGGGEVGGGREVGWREGSEVERGKVRWREGGG